jgi:hypothetical protein
VSDIIPLSPCGVSPCGVNNCMCQGVGGADQGQQGSVVLGHKAFLCESVFTAGQCWSGAVGLQISTVASVEALLCSCDGMSRLQGLLATGVKLWPAVLER